MTMTDVVVVDFRPEFFLFHDYGPTQRAAFSSAADALVWQAGNLARPHAGRFYITDRHGLRATLAQNSHGHAYVVADAVRGRR